VIEVPETFRRMPRWWHDVECRGWLDALPRLVDHRCRAWDLVLDGPARHGSNALVVPARRGAERFALRLAPPGDDIRSEVRALLMWAGRGTVLLHDAAEDDRSMLLERLDPARSLGALPIDEAVPLLGGIARALAVPVDDAVPTTRDITAAHVEGFERDWLAAGSPTPRSDLDRALADAEDRASAPAARTAADGDLHFDQVLAGERMPWIVVDPVLLRGNPEYDLGRVLWSRLDELPGDRDVLAAFDAFVSAAQVPADRAAAWVRIRSMSYLLWGLERGLTLDPPRCRRLLRVFSG